jgi:drug/metabolite transporter (DMT)-like permease
LAIQDSKTYRGYLFIAGSAFCWGISAALGRAAFTGRLLPGGQTLPPIDPVILSQTRMTFAFLVFLSVLAISRGWKKLSIPVADAVRLCLIGILGLAGANYFYYLAIQRTNVATAITLQYTAPVWVLLYAIATRQQRPSVPRIVSVMLAVLGIALVIGIFEPGSLRLDTVGLIAGIVAAFTFAFYSIAGRSLLARYDHWLVLLYSTLGASLLWIVVNPPGKILAANYSAAQWAFLCMFALVSSLVPFSLFFAGLKYLEPTRAVVASCLEPVFSIAITAAFLGETVRTLQTVGIAVVLGAIVIVQIPDRKTSPKDFANSLQ